jgi:catechol 2,3-dioxygenase-like lactoylglutathione lyase family enzyme
MKLRSIELSLPDIGGAGDFLTRIWGLVVAEQRDGSLYLRGSAGFPYLVALNKGVERRVLSTTFTCTPPELDAIRARALEAGAACNPTRSSDPGGGQGVVVTLPEGERFRFLADATEVAPLVGCDMPVKLTHIVMNSSNAEATATFAERALGFRVSDRTKGMVFVRCNDSHHSTAFARAGYPSLNHIAFEMADLDAVMRGIGRMRDHGFAPAWGPGRHGPGANVFAYYIAPFGGVVEYSTAVDIVTDDYKAGNPEDWTWPPGRIDQWGMSDKDLQNLGVAERQFLHPEGNRIATP